MHDEQKDLLAGSIKLGGFIYQLIIYIILNA
jgi:hypothetical protein